MVVLIPISYIGSAESLSQSLRKVDSVAVKVVFIQPMVEDAIPMLHSPRIAVIEVVSWRKRMHGYFVEPRVIFGNSAICVLIHANHGVQSEAVVGHNVHDHGDSPSVSFIHQEFQ